MTNNIIPISPALIELLNKSGNQGVVPFTQEIFLLDLTVAGTSHIPNIEELADKIVPGTTLVLKRDPDNEYDEMAIALYLGDQRVGWVPMSLNLIIARLMDAGKAFVCRVNESEWRHGHWFCIKAKLSMIE